MKVRLGAPTAITATAHKLARLVSSRLQHGSADVPQGRDADAAPSRARQVTAMAKPAKALGETLVPLAAQGASWPLRPCSSSRNASTTLQHTVSPGLRGRSVPRTPRRPTPPVNRGSPTAVPPSRTLLTLSERPSLVGEFLGRRGTRLRRRATGRNLEPIGALFWANGRGRSRPRALWCRVPVGEGGPGSPRRHPW